MHYFHALIKINDKILLCMNEILLSDGQLLIPPGQAGAEIFNCPDDYIVISGIRLCGERFNDASVQVDFTRNYPVTGKQTAII
jgi:hypothetical protein